MDMNMDVKDIIAKLKNKNNGDSRNRGSIAVFFEKNPKMKYIIPAIFIAISILVAVLIIIKTGKAKIPEIPAGNENATVQADVLPQEVLEGENLDGIEDRNLFNEAVLKNPSVSMVMQSSEGYFTATVETANGIYPSLHVGDFVHGSDWQVTYIDYEKVIFECNGQKVTVQTNIQ